MFHPIRTTRPRLATVVKRASAQGEVEHRLPANPEPRATSITIQ